MRPPLVNPSFRAFEIGETEQSIPARFAKQVERFSERIAIRTLKDTVSYAQLDRDSNKIARLLIANGVQAEPVALIVGDEVKLITSILGVLKAGALYVSLDGRDPKAQLEATLVHVGARHLLVDLHNAADASDLVVDTNLMEVEPGLEAMSSEPLTRDINPDSFAYIYYTSGTTGRPKGVVDNHRNVLHNTLRYTNSLAVGSTDRLTLLQSCSFSAVVSSIFTALLNGATLLPFDLRTHGVGRLATWLDEAGATIYHSVPSVFRRVVQQPAQFESLRVVRLEGDRATARDIELYQRHCPPGCMLVNGLGATETGISRQYFVDRDTLLPGNRVPVGYPTADMEVLIAREDGTVLPDGEVGEIVVRSRYIACGYWRNAEETDARFLRSEEDRAVREYRSGDLGRMSAQCLDHLGRMDRRLKVSGEWVDLDAVEAALTACEGVHGAIVNNEPDTDGESRLVAYVITSADIASSLRSQLESQMDQKELPRIIVGLDSWPLDPNGKVDRDALSALRKPDSGASFSPPQGETETIVAAVFSNLLGCANVGRDAHLFDLGGDSLTAVEAALRLSELFACDAPVTALQATPTVRGVATAIERDHQYDVLVPLQTDGDKRPVFCVHAHMGHVFNLRNLAGLFAPDRPFFGLQACAFAPGSMPETLAGLADHYVGAIRRRQPIGPYALAGYCFGGLVALEMARILRAQGERVSMLALIDSDLPTPFSPTVWRRMATRAAKVREPRRFASAVVSRIRGFPARPRTIEAPVPELIRNTRDDLASMLRRHRADPYPGDGLVIIPAGKPGSANWSRLLAEGAREVRIDAPPADLLRPPYVAALAAVLQASLDPH